MIMPWFAYPRLGQLCVGVVLLLVVTAFVARGALAQRLTQAEASLRDARVSMQRAANVLKWLERDAQARAAILRDQENLAVTLADSIGKHAEIHELANWQLTTSESVAMRKASEASLSVGVIRLLIEFESRHGSEFLAQIDEVLRAGGERPVIVSACRIERIDAEDAGRVLMSRCTLEWPWWSWQR